MIVICSPVWFCKWKRMIFGRTASCLYTIPNYHQSYIVWHIWHVFDHQSPFLLKIIMTVQINIWYCGKCESINVIYCFSSISRSTKAIYKFQKLRRLLEIYFDILIVHPFNKWGWGFVLMGECLGLYLYRQHLESWLQFCLVQ